MFISPESKTEKNAIFLQEHAKKKKWLSLIIRSCLQGTHLLSWISRKPE